MIEGKWYKGADIQGRLETGTILTGATCTVLVEFNGGTVVKEYAGTIDDFTGVTFTIPAADNIYSREIVLRVGVTFPGTGKKYGDPETMNILDVPAVTA